MLPRFRPASGITHLWEAARATSSGITPADVRRGGREMSSLVVLVTFDAVLAGAQDATGVRAIGVPARHSVGRDLPHARCSACVKA